MRAETAIRSRLGLLPYTRPPSTVPNGSGLLKIFQLETFPSLAGPECATASDPVTGGV